MLVFHSMSNNYVDFYECDILYEIDKSQFLTSSQKKTRETFASICVSAKFNHFWI